MDINKRTRFNLRSILHHQNGVDSMGIFLITTESTCWMLLRPLLIA